MNSKGVDKYVKIIEIRQNLSKVCNMNDCDQIPPLLDSLKNCGYTRC